MKGIFNKEDSFIKDIARKYVLAECSKMFNKIQGIKKIFSLSADNFIFEKELLNKYRNVKIISIERNKSVYNKGKKKIKDEKIKIEYYNREDTDFFMNTKERFDIIWLDYCGSINSNLLTNLIPIVQGNFFKDEGLLAITLLKGREWEKKRLEKSFKTKNIREELFTILDIYAKWNNRSIEPINLLEYKDGSNGKSSTMLLYVMKVTKKNNYKQKQITKTVIKI